jgi:hypothetical protein
VAVAALTLTESKCCPDDLGLPSSRERRNAFAKVLESEAPWIV